MRPSACRRRSSEPPSLRNRPLLTTLTLGARSPPLLGLSRWTPALRPPLHGGGSRALGAQQLLEHRAAATGR
eukprot:2691504-Alexandrium_andersonii.AAC.1